VCTWETHLAGGALQRDSGLCCLSSLPDSVIAAARPTTGVINRTGGRSLQRQRPQGR
jgi:hypothetical protein